MSGAAEQPPCLARHLEALENGLGLAFDRFGLAASVIDRDGTIRWLSERATELVGDAIGRKFTSVIAPQHIRSARSEFARSLFWPTDTKPYRLVVVSRAARRIPLRLAAAPLREDGAVVGVFALGFEERDHGETRVVAPATEPVIEPLTPRQHEVLRLLAEGLGTREIAGQLGIAEETVRNHIRALLRKLGAHSRLEAVVIAARAGLL